MSSHFGTFLSSSSTLGEGLELMSKPVDDVVGPHFQLDEEERALQAELEARKPCNRKWMVQPFYKHVDFEKICLTFRVGWGCIQKSCRPSTRRLKLRNPQPPRRASHVSWTSPWRPVGCEWRLVKL